MTKHKTIQSEINYVDNLSYVEINYKNNGMKLKKK